MCVCVCERERERERERESVCEREREREKCDKNYTLLYNFLHEVYAVCVGVRCCSLSLSLSLSLSVCLSVCFSLSPSPPPPPPLSLSLCVANGPVTSYKWRHDHRISEALTLYPPTGSWPAHQRNAVQHW